MTMLAGKVAFVTGSNAGLGRCIVNHFAAAGARGIGLDINDEQPALPDGWEPLQGDVADNASLTSAIAKIKREYGRLDIVVANAGLVPPWRETENLDFAEWDQVFAVNVRGVAATISLALPLMRQTGGSIIAMASLNSHRAHSRQCLYTATKHAVLGIVRSVALDVGRFGIRVNALGPGPVATEALLERVQQRAQDGGPAVQDALDAFASDAALGRMATADDVARVALFLASEQSSGVTGQLYPIDAGLP